MALQATGPVKYSEIEAEFGRSYSAVDDNWTRVFGPDYDDSYFQIFNKLIGRFIFNIKIFSHPFNIVKNII